MDAAPQKLTLSPDNAKELIRESELYLDGLLKISFASDARAMQLAAMSAAASTALLVLVANSVNPSIEKPNLVLIAACLAGAFCFLVALYFALQAAKPRNFGISGSHLDRWEPEELVGNLAEVLHSQCEVYQDLITSNLQKLTINSERVKLALYALTAAPVAAAVAALLLYAFTH